MHDAEVFNSAFNTSSLCGTKIGYKGYILFGWKDIRDSWCFRNICSHTVHIQNGFIARKVDFENRLQSAHLVLDF